MSPARPCCSSVLMLAALVASCATDRHAKTPREPEGDTTPPPDTDSTPLDPPPQEPPPPVPPPPLEPPPQGSPPRIAVPASITLAEEEDFVLAIQVSGAPEDGPVRVSLLGLPPGARFDALSCELRFRPDFTQGGRDHDLTVLADNAHGRTTQTFVLAIADTVQPPSPLVSSYTDEYGFTIYELVQRTDEFLAGPHLGGEEYPAVVSVPPHAASAPPRRYPVQIVLHGYQTPLFTSIADYEVRIHPYDPLWSSFFGYSDAIPNERADWRTVHAYTERRILHLLAWTLANVPSADPERVYVNGASMGGAGAAKLALSAQRHIAFGEAHFGGTIPRHNTREWKRAEIEALWGSFDAPLSAVPPMSAWDLLDLTRVLRDEPLARHQLLFAEHSKGDNTVHFGAAVRESPLTCLSFYEAAQRAHLGHYFVWHEGLHNEPDPNLGARFWTSRYYNPVLTGVARRDRAFVAFSKSTCDQDPGDGSGDGSTEWNEDGGFATFDGYSGWSGDDAGVLNRFLEWDGANVIDEVDVFTMPLRVLSGDGSPSADGRPSLGDYLDCALPVRVDVTPRRTQAFQVTPGEIVRFSFADLAGEVVANDDGSVTIPSLPLTTAWQALRIERLATPRFATPQALFEPDTCAP